MGDGKAHLAFMYIVMAVAAILMGIHYLGVVKPEYLVPNFLLDIIAPMAFDGRVGIRFGFVFVTLLVSTISSTSLEIGDEIARNQKAKVVTVVLLLVSIYFLLTIEDYPFLMFAVLYPIMFVLFIVTSFIVPNIFKTKKDKFNVLFGFKPVWAKYENVDNQTIHFFGKLDGYINIENLYRGLLIIGGAGSGKSYSLIEPLIEQFFGIRASQVPGGTGLIFDFKMNQNFSPNPKDWALTRYTYMVLLKYITKPAKKDKDGKWIGGPHSVDNDRRRFWIINFKDPRYSHRINPVAPQYLANEAYANEFALSLLTNLEPKWSKDKDFFASSAIVYFKAILWFLKTNYSEMCTVPHAVTAALLPYNQVLAALSLNPQCVEMLGALKVADDKNAEGQLAGVDASLKTPVDKINSPEIFWVLSGNDFSLKLNDKENPGIMCLGSDAELQETYSPVCALIATVARKVMNDTNRLPSVYMLDEFPQLNIPNLDLLPAVSRSNKMAVILAGQTVAQAILNYGKEKADSLIANLGTHIYGQLNDQAEQERASKEIGTREKEKKSYSDSTPKGEGSKSTSESTSLEKENLIHPHEIGTLPKGRFVGKLAEVSEDPKTQKPLYEPFFNVKVHVERTFIEHDFPQIVRHPEDPNPLSQEQMMDIMRKNFEYIKRETAIMIDRAARTACAIGKADEEKVFPKHFQKVGNEVIRVVSTDGKVMPGIEGVTVEGELYTVKGKARKAKNYGQEEEMIAITVNSDKTKIS